jgi:predicted acetyltransferase
MEYLVLNHPTEKDEQDAIEYINEFIEFNSNINGTRGLKNYLDNYSEWLSKLEADKNEAVKLEQGEVPRLTYFAKRNSDGKIVGMINIRLMLNDKLLQTGGHVGYSVRPSERLKGYAAEMLKQGLLILKDNGIQRALITCEKNNIGSVKTILKNNGLFENEFYNEESKEFIQRYWININ